MSRMIATVFGVGLMKPAPGTWGSLAALPLAWAIHTLGGFPALAIATLAVCGIGWWATAEATKGAADHDPSEIVIDEVAGQWIALWPVSAGAWHVGAEISALWPGWIAAFALFRLFDIWKPGPVGLADKRHDAAGVMLDDIVAGVLAAICVAVLAFLAHVVLI
ncbi:phosphatidylglycerophosphatase A family protein [Dinoroseobacter sp. S76]|uniref:phosphatidylglycerophosphatase A family protein n=1 Tax=Dinoroseobacter sp. S76 TaxID=3415124 RepID=UPI003C7A5EFD